MTLIDQGATVRNGEELDIAAVDAWLKPRLPGLTGLPEVTQYSGGASNWTYRLKYPGSDLILRRPPAGTKAKSAHDMTREYTVQSCLKPFYPVVPAMLALCQDESVIGSDFYIMERIAGIIPRANLPRELDVSKFQMRVLCLNVLNQLIALHQVDYRAAGLEHLGKGDGYARSRAGMNASRMPEHGMCRASRVCGPGSRSARRQIAELASFTTTGASTMSCCPKASRHA